MAVTGTPPVGTIDGVPATLGGAMGAGQEVATAGLDDLRTRLDLLAVGLRDALNSAHTSGFDLDGNAGGPLFTGTGASSFAVDPAITARRLAASTTGAAPDGNNALVISALRDQTIVGSVNAPTTLTLRPHATHSLTSPPSSASARRPPNEPRNWSTPRLLRPTPGATS